MASLIHNSEESTKECAKTALHMTALVEELRDDAFKAARKKLALTAEKQPLVNLFADADFRQYFRYELAARVARALAAYDDRTLAVYLLGPSGDHDHEPDADPSIDATVNMLVLVSTPSAALRMFIDSLDRALTNSLKEFPSPLFQDRRFTLNVSLITKEDVKFGRGHAVLLSTWFSPVIKVWARESS